MKKATHTHLIPSHTHRHKRLKERGKSPTYLHVHRYTLPIIKRCQPDWMEDTLKDSKDELLMHRFVPSDKERRQQGRGKEPEKPKS